MAEVPFADHAGVITRRLQALTLCAAAALESGAAGAQSLTADEARQLAVDAGDLPREFIASDETPGGVLGDEEKPLTEAPPTTTTKAARAEAAALIDRELDAALDLVASVLGR